MWSIPFCLLAFCCYVQRAYCVERTLWYGIVCRVSPVRTACGVDVSCEVLEGGGHPSLSVLPLQVTEHRRESACVVGTSGRAPFLGPSLVEE